jgi:hypothetical protein
VKQQTTTRDHLPLEGMTLPTKNSFSILSNDEIVVLAADMGVTISIENFHIVDIMKDLESARLALDKTKSARPPEQIEEVEPNVEIDSNDVPLLEWLDDDFEGEQFILVQSRKKRKETTRLENSAGTIQVRRSRRTTPSVYRCMSGGGQENPVPMKKIPRNKKVP